MVKIIVVDDMLLLRDSLANIINGQEDMQAVGTASHADALNMCKCKELAPDLTLIGVSSDTTSAPSSALALTTDIRRELPEVKIVIMADGADAGLMDAARHAGVNSFVYKNAGLEHLLYVIRRTINGMGFYPSPCESRGGNEHTSKTH